MFGAEQVEPGGIFNVLAKREMSERLEPDECVAQSRCNQFPALQFRVKNVKAGRGAVLKIYVKNMFRH